LQKKREVDSNCLKTVAVIEPHSHKVEQRGIGVAGHHRLVSSNESKEPLGGFFSLHRYINSFYVQDTWRISRHPLAVKAVLPVPLPRVSGITLSVGREVEGRVLIAQEHQLSPPEPDVRLVTASGSHGISYVFLIHTGCMPDQRDSSHRNLHGESSDGM